MERDFMGLNFNDSVVEVKEEPVESCQNSGFRWPLSSKVHVSHFMSLNSAQDERLFKALPATDGVDVGLKHQSGEIQSVHAMHLPHDVKMLPFNMNNPSCKTHFGGTGQKSADAVMKQQLLGGIPVTVPHSMLPSRGSVAGKTEPWFNSKGSAAPAQLTIFYGGTVNVFDDISPEKAQAIMFLAGNDCAPNMVQPRFQLKASAPKPAAVDGTCMNQTPNMLPASGLSSPMSVSSHPIGQFDGSTGNKDDMKISKTANISVAPLGSLETPKVVTSLGPVGVTTIMPAAVPQARKASLARFLEKRKERVMNLAPYVLSKKSPECSTPESNEVGSSATSSVATSPR